MKRIILIILVSWLLVRLGVLDMLLALLFAGIVPGTKMALPAGLMLTVYLVAGALLFHRLVLAKAMSRKQTQPTIVTRRTATPRRSKAKAAVPVRRRRTATTKRSYSRA